MNLAAYTRSRPTRFDQESCFPTYSENGDVCSIVVEKRRFSSNTIDLESELSAEQINSIFDQVAAKKNRGQPSWGSGTGGSLTIINGPAIVTTTDYENVSLQMFANARKVTSTGYVAAIITWKKSECNQH